MTEFYVYYIDWKTFSNFSTKILHSFSISNFNRNLKHFLPFVYFYIHFAGFKSRKPCFPNFQRVNKLRKEAYAKNFMFQSSSLNNLKLPPKMNMRIYI